MAVSTLGQLGIPRSAGLRGNYGGKQPLPDVEIARTRRRRWDPTLNYPPFVFLLSIFSSWIAEILGRTP